MGSKVLSLFFLPCFLAFLVILPSSTTLGVLQQCSNNLLLDPSIENVDCTSTDNYCYQATYDGVWKGTNVDIVKAPTYPQADGKYAIDLNGNTGANMFKQTFTLSVRSDLQLTFYAASNPGGNDPQYTVELTGDGGAPESPKTTVSQKASTSSVNNGYQLQTVTFSNVGTGSHDLILRGYPITTASGVFVDSFCLTTAPVGNCIGVYQCTTAASAELFMTYTGGSCMAATRYPTNAATGANPTYVAIVSTIGPAGKITLYTVPDGGVCSEVTIINAGGTTGACAQTVGSTRSQYLKEAPTKMYKCDDTTSTTCAFTSASATDNAHYDTTASAKTGTCTGVCCCYASLTTASSSADCPSAPPSQPPTSNPMTYSRRDVGTIEQIRRDIIAINSTLPNILAHDWVQQMFQ